MDDDVDCGSLEDNWSNNESSLAELIREVIKDDLTNTHSKVRFLIKSIKKLYNLSSQLPDWIELSFDLFRGDLFYSNKLPGEKCYKKIINQFFRIATKEDIKEWCTFLSNNIEIFQSEEEILIPALNALMNQKIDVKFEDDTNNRITSVYEIFSEDEHILSKDVFLAYLQVLNHLTNIYEKKGGSSYQLDIWKTGDTFNYIISYVMDYPGDKEIRDAFKISLGYFRPYWVDENEEAVTLGIAIYNDMIAYIINCYDEESSSVNCLFMVLTEIVGTLDKDSVDIFFGNIIQTKKILSDMNVWNRNSALVRIYLLVDCVKNTITHDTRYEIMTMLNEYADKEVNGGVLICLLEMKDILLPNRVQRCLEWLMEGDVLFDMWKRQKIVEEKSLNVLKCILNSIDTTQSMFLYKQLAKKSISLMEKLKVCNVDEKNAIIIETNIIYCLKILETIILKKQSVMTLMSYQPSFFIFLFQQINIPWKNVKNISDEFILYIITLQKNFSLIYDFYISNYVWEDEGNSSILKLSPSSKHFCIILSVLVDYFNHFEEMKYDSIFSVILWTMKIFKEHDLIIKKNFNQPLLKKFRFYISINILSLMGSFKFDEYFEDKAYFNKFGPLTLDEETLAINLMNGAQLLIEKCQWHINDYNMEELYDTFLKVVRKCDHTQFIYLMKVLPPTFVLSYSLTKGYLPPEQTFTYSTCLVMYKDDFIRIMDFVYRKIDMGINFQRDLFLKWYFNPTDIFNVDSVGVKYPTEYWDLICVGIAMYFYNEQFNTPVGCMWKTLLFMEEVSTVLLTEINESLEIETNDGDGFLNYKMDLQEEMMEKARICDLNGEGTNNFSIDYDYSFEYKGMEHIYVDRKPLYEETILRFSLWVKIIFNVLKYFEVFPKDSTDRDSDDKVVVRNNFIRQNEEELKKAFYRIVIPVIKVAYRIGHYGTSIKLCEMILRLADKKDFYDSKPINVSDEIKDKIIEILPWMIRSYYKTSCGQSLKGIKKYFEETFCIYNLYWTEDLEDIIQGNLEKGLSSLNTKKNLFFQNHIDEICSEVASILNYYKDEKSFEKNKDDSSEISNDRKGNNYLNKGKKKKKRKIINSDRIIDSLNSWDSIPKEPLEKYSIIYDSKRFTDFIEGNVLATYECFVDLRNVALKKYNKILWQSSELLQTIGRFSLTQQSNAKSFLSSYCSYLITEDVKKRLTLRLNKVQFSEDIELPLKLVNSKILDECLSSSPIECIEIGKKVSWWLNHCGHYVHAKLASKFYLDTAHLAIKSGNENLAKDQLYHYKKAISKISKYDYPLENLYGNILSIDYDIRFKDRDVTFKHIGLMGKAISTFGEQFFEKNQLSRVIPTNVEVIENEISNINVIATNKINIDYYKKQIEREIELKGLSKAILRMGILIMENNENLQKYTECLSDPTQGSFINKLIKPYVRQFHSTIEFSDMATSVVFPSFATLASKFSPKYLKPYLMLGDYAFIKGSKNSSDYLPVTEMEEKQIKNHLSNIKKYFNDEEFKKLCLIVLSTNTISSLRNNLVNFIKQCPLYRGEAEVLSDIVMNDIPFTSLFTKILNRQSKFFTISTKAYEQYLSLVDSPHSSSEITKAVLRIYKMIVLCPQVLSRLICSIIKKVNEDVWKNILPQLIPRFSHPNRFVRETIYNILESVAKTSPHVLVFPIVVAKNNVRDEDMYFNTMNKAKFDSLKSMAKEKEKVFIAEYCTKLSNYIEEKHPGLIDSVSGFVDETKKINMLLDEKWIYVLSKCDSEMKKKYSSYCSYIKRGYDPRTSEAERIIIGKEKLKISSMMIYQALDDLYASTFNKSYECQYEKDFLASFEGIIKEAYEKYKSYKHDNDPMKAFLPFQELLKELVCLKNVRIQKMNLEDLNNKLYNMKGGIIPLPGQDKKRYNDPSFISIEKMSNNVIVIQSLTRPKKVEFYGNDGTSHCYLVKGYEDMHLDERLQQILRICNQILNNKKYKLSGDYDYSYEAKNYSVTPIGARSGLIKYVSEAVQMFTSYYNWLQKNKIKFEGEVSEEVNSIKKARHFFVGRVKRYLDINDNDKIIDINEYRTKENTRAFVRAFNEISDIVPKNIITNKIGKIIIDGDHWHHITKTYSRSVAVMSMIGWLFGLGDRHLSNIMIIYSTGEILHIDYNVCFGKFKNLKCPEKVPFRLTRNIVDVMGPLKTEGVFRESCKHVLKCLKEEHEILYNILETYAYDPLADWSSISEMKNQGEILPLDIMFAVYGRSVFEVKSFLERSFRLFKVRVMESSLMVRDFGKMICDAIENLNRMYKQENDSNGEYSQDKKEYDLECAKFNNAQKPLDNISNQIRSPLAKLSAYNNDFASLERLFFSELIPKVKKACMLIVPHEYNHNLNCERIKLLNEISELTKNSILYIKKLSAKDIVFNEENIYSLKRDSRHCDSSSQLKNEHAVSIINDVKSRFNKLFRENNDDVNKINNLTTPETSLEVERRIDTIVSNLINEATDVKNLSFMYEGWAAWV